VESTAGETIRQTASDKAPAQPSESRDPRALAEIRRINLHTLTTHKGAKSQLGRLLEIGQSNMAHRLHGQKRMDDVEAQRVTDKLGLPSGWLDIPRELADVPEAVIRLLSTSSRGRSAQPQPDSLHPGRKAGGRASMKETATMKDAPGRRAAPAAADSPALPAITAPGGNAELPLEQPLDAGPLTKPAVHDEVATSSISESPDVYPSMSATSLDTLRGIAPIAEALIKTLAGKARAGRMDETKALQLLQQVVLL
jgi:hypothetical protein